MMIPAPRPEASPLGDVAEAEQPISDTPVSVLGASPEWLQDAALQLAYPEFVSALKDALRDFHRPDLLSRNPLLRHGSWGLDPSAGPPELEALLSDTVATLFGNTRDEKLRRAIELTYFQPALKQEVVADRLSLSFGTYRRYLTTARDRLARWLWENARSTPVPPEGRSTSPPLRSEETPENGNTAASERRGAEVPRLSIVVLPFVNLGGTLACDHVVDGITETLTTDLSRRSDVFVISRSTAFAYKGKPVDSREIGRELGVRYILEGSVQ